MEPGDPARMNNLAYLLIDKDLNINEGMDLVETALAIQPENYTCTLEGGAFIKGGITMKLYQISIKAGIKSLNTIMIFFFIVQK